MRVFLLIAFAAVYAASAEENAADSNQHIMSFDACKEDIHKLCNNKGVDLSSDMSILECLQDAGYSETATLTQQCEQLVWQFKLRLTKDDRFTAAAKEYCADEIKSVKGMGDCLNSQGSTEHSGYVLSCFLDFVQNVTQTSKCYAFLSRTERLAFSDFRLIGPFVDKCENAIKKFNCNVLTPTKAHEKVRVPHTQGMTLECLIDRVVKSAKTEQDAMAILDPDCRHQVMRLAEMQSDDWHLDRPLFFACRDDREKFCANVPAGQGKVYECLLLKRTEQNMRPECQAILHERAYMLGRDYRMAHPLTKACQNEMTQFKCEAVKELEAAAHFHLSWILLCLENAAHSNKENVLSPACKYEVTNHRQLMMSEFQMAPELVMDCAQEIDKWCSPRGDIEAKGLTLHCLMEHAQSRNESLRLGEKCMQAVTGVVKTADIGSNYRVDRVLYASCKPLIEGPCAQDAVSETATLTCLMKHVDNQDMSRDCEQRLLEVQYFMARDWTLDPQLYNACHQDAVTKCSALDDWHMMNNDHNKVDPGPQVLACLYRSAYDTSNPLSPQCGAEVLRVLHTRAARVNLLPNLEDNCRVALSEYCSHNVQPMEEMQCLQDNFEKPEFKAKHGQCYKELVKFTEMESKDTKLNQALTRACKPVILTHCEQFKDEEIDHGDVMECLYKNKDAKEMTSKCRSYVNHFELISMRDYHFSYRFQQECGSDIQKHCANHANDKGEIIRCLSEVRFVHKVLGQGEDLADGCKKQLKAAYLQQEQVEFDQKDHMADADPTLAHKCKSEITRYQCDQVNTFEDQIECLRRNFDDLGPECKSMIFYREKIEAIDNSMDDELQKKCKYDISKYCKNQNGENVLSCLTNTKIVRLLQRECKVVVKERMEESARDVRLRPSLLEACKAEAESYCGDEVAKLKDPQYSQFAMPNLVVACLRDKYRLSAHEQIHISQPCQIELANVIVEAEFDPKLDPKLYGACKETINRHCSSSVIKGSGSFDNVIECLKADFNKGAITDRQCSNEIARRIEETLVDIHLDPELFEACSQDVNRYCREVEPGHSRIVMCLMDVMEKTNVQMKTECRNKLMDRNKLWMKAHEDFKMQLPENWHEVVQFVVNHPHKVSLLGWLGGIVFFLFLIGCCCGRVTKRAHMELKNR